MLKLIPRTKMEHHWGSMINISAGWVCYHYTHGCGVLFPNLLHAGIENLTFLCSLSLRVCKDSLVCACANNSMFHLQSNANKYTVAELVFPLFLHCCKHKYKSISDIFGILAHSCYAPKPVGCRFLWIMFAIFSRCCRQKLFSWHCG